MQTGEKKNSGRKTFYSLHGHRKCPLTSGELGEYAFKDTASAQEMDSVAEGISRLVRDMEEMGHTLICSRREFEDIMTTKQILNLPSARGHLKRSIATQFALGENYWSQVHFDYDAFLCLLSVLSGKSRYNTRIMYYFCFPQYKVAVPLQAGDILILIH